MKILLIIHDAPYGSERTYNGLRTAMALQRGKRDIEIFLFLFADAVTALLVNQETTQGFYNIERMLKSIIKKGGRVSYCGTCAQFRGLENLDLIEGAEKGGMDLLADWIEEADKVISF